MDDGYDFCDPLSMSVVKQTNEFPYDPFPPWPLRTSCEALEVSPPQPDEASADGPSPAETYASSGDVTPVQNEDEEKEESEDDDNALEVDPATLLPSGLPLPAILGGPMPPVPKRRRRRKDLAPGEEDEDEDTPDRLEVRLPRKTLLAVSSEQIGAFVRNLRHTMRLTKGQEKELKRQKRLVKNRESARNSRRKKVDHVEELDMRIARLEEENRRLKSENERLQAAAASSAKALSATTSLSPPLGSSTFSWIDDPTVEAAAEAEAPSSSFNRSIRVAGVCLLVVMFSFGIVFNVSRAPGGLNVPRLFKREAIPQVEPAVSAYARPFAYMPPMSNGFSAFNNFNSLSNRAVAVQRQATTAARPSEQQRKPMGEYETVKLSDNKYSDAELTGSPASQMTAASEPRRFAGRTITDKNKTQGWKPKNQTYLLVGDASRADPPIRQQEATAPSDQGQEQDRRSPNTIGIIMPLSSLQTCEDDPEGEGVNDGSLVELTCSVLEVNRLPKDAVDPRKTDDVPQNEP